ncbi:hypothetical protein FB567DRAFT_69197 [Paraphoma chrysanthemicola]|uniref:Uncharacterized protein n=1 Tax=Paraphoma chrysanthemicola TaxID=798071 RepID=A0A8K0R2R5_9PLEO|nr:hypothetical protein FB567DRAFT_69197 [Paraphoma chrysanthemicola]
MEISILAMLHSSLPFVSSLQRAALQLLVQLASALHSYGEINTLPHSARPHRQMLSRQLHRFETPCLNLKLFLGQAAAHLPLCNPKERLAVMMASYSKPTPLDATQQKNDTNEINRSPRR